MKSFLFSTDNERGGVMLCDIDTLEDAVEYLKERFAGVVRVEQGKDYWDEAEGFCFQTGEVDAQHQGEDSST
ncbi:hypothetical protein [Neptunomonas concharum]|uniref:Uncharacterized protein n=1 Tax=Neptunomonas concharum TaxID=1031538 RepID=A0A5P1RC25_9GAMM|nr:hypothetical protein [Neptunomonas concharum]QEQ97214.1 hypothetical protein F0U83_11085 [Neptunomonas concharum]